MGKPEIIDIIRNSKPEMEALYGVKKVGLFRDKIGVGATHFTINTSLRELI